MNTTLFGAAYLLLALFSASLPRFEPLHVWPAHGLALGALLLAAPKSVVFILDSIGILRVRR